MFKTVYRNGAMLPDPGRIADAQHVKRNADTGEISWPPTRMDDVLRQLGLINKEDSLS